MIGPKRARNGVLELHGTHGVEPSATAAVVARRGGADLSKSLRESSPSREYVQCGEGNVHAPAAAATVHTE